jgi:hypothetical protein
MDELTTLISNVGFPIAAFCAMFYMCNTTIKENTKAIIECTTAIKLLNSDGKEEKNL